MFMAQCMLITAQRPEEFHDACQAGYTAAPQDMHEEYMHALQCWVMSAQSVAEYSQRLGMFAFSQFVNFQKAGSTVCQYVIRDTQP